MTTGAPQYRIRLEGLAADLEDLASCLKGKTRVIRQNEAYFLESEILDNIADPAEIREKAHELLRVVSGVARVRRSIAKPVTPTAILWKDKNGSWRQTLTATDSLTVYSHVAQLTAPGLFDGTLELALRDETVRMNLDDFLGDWDFPRLRRIGEAVLFDL